MRSFPRREGVVENTLVRSTRCPECGVEMLWTQNAWKTGDTGSAAYRCLNGHVIDPGQTRQCPECGVHDTQRLEDAGGVAHFRCTRCGTAFTYPH
jgi:tRNA(Ile2) C34 agmatinyltransferase TiaS